MKPEEVMEMPVMPFGPHSHLPPLSVTPPSSTSSIWKVPTWKGLDGSLMFQISWM